MPTVTSGVDALLSISGTTTAAGTLTKALQGAEADPTKIGAEYMPDVLDPETIIVPDFPVAYVPPINSIGMRDGQLAVGDGVTEQGNPVTGNVRRYVGYKNVAMSGNSNEHVESLVAISFSAEEMAIGNQIKITGRTLYMSNGMDALSQLHIGLSSPITLGFFGQPIYYDPGITGSVLTDDRTWHALLELTDGGGGSYILVEALSPGTTAFCTFTTDSGSGFPVKYSSSGAASINATEVGVADGAQDLTLFIEMDRTTAGNFGTCGFTVLWDLTFEVITP